MLDEHARAFVLDRCGARGLGRATPVQTLWAGFGMLWRVELAGAELDSAVLKDVRPPCAGLEGLSHRRKCRSYEVEGAFYERYAARCPRDARVARHLGQERHERGWLLALEDLDTLGYTRRVSVASPTELEACLGWLARFHAAFLGEAPCGLWEEGSYWHLATRLDELRALGDRDLERRAHELDRALCSARFRTLVHGDAKPANFCFTPDGADAAAVDFQYVGGGAGVRDVACLLHRVADGELCARLVERYFAHLRDALAPSVDARALEREWRGLFDVAVGDFQRFLRGWRG